MLGRGPKINLIMNPSNCCAYCNKRIRDWKLFCNQKCYDEQQTLEQIQFDNDQAYQAFYECDEHGHPSSWEETPPTSKLERSDAMFDTGASLWKKEKRIRLEKISSGDFLEISKD